MKYDICFGADVSCYGHKTVEADTPEEAIAKAKQLYEDGDEPTMNEEWGTLHDWRIVDIRENDFDGPIVAEEIDLDPQPLLDNAYTLLAAAKDLMDLMDEVPTGECASVSYDQEDRCFARYEFGPLRAAIHLCEGRTS